MPKQKTHKGAAKRFKISGGGKVMRQQSMRQHIMTKKSTKRKRNLRKKTTATGELGRKVKEMLHQ